MADNINSSINLQELSIRDLSVFLCLSATWTIGCVIIIILNKNVLNLALATILFFISTIVVDTLIKSRIYIHNTGLATINSFEELRSKNKRDFYTLRWIYIWIWIGAMFGYLILILILLIVKKTLNLQDVIGSDISIFIGVPLMARLSIGWSIDLLREIVWHHLQRRATIQTNRASFDLPSVGSLNV